MKAINILKNHIRDLEKMVLVFDEYAMYKSRDESKKAIQELTQVIEELEAIKSNIKSSIQEIEWALAKLEYTSAYLNNALRFLKERK